MIFALIAVVVVMLVAAALAPARARRGDETERFHRAATLTSEWARGGVTRPLMLGEQPGARDRSRDGADA